MRSQEGRREDRVRAAPAVSCAKGREKAHTSIQVQRKQSGLPCAMALRLIPCSPRRDHSLFVTVAHRKRELSANLTPAIGASGPHDFAVRFSHARQSQPSRPPLPAPTFSDDGRRPLFRNGMRHYAGDLGQKKREYFLPEVWTTEPNHRRYKRFLRGRCRMG